MTNKDRILGAILSTATLILSFTGAGLLIYIIFQLFIKPFFVKGLIVSDIFTSLEPKIILMGVSFLLAAITAKALNKLTDKTINKDDKITGNNKDEDVKYLIK